MDFWDRIDQRFLRVESFCEKGVRKLGSRHWFARLVAFSIFLLVFTALGYRISPTVGCVSVGALVGLAAGAMAATRFPRQLQAALIGALSVWVINGLLFGAGPRDPSTSAAGIGNFLSSIVLSVHGALSATRIGPPPEEAVARGVFSFLAAVLLCLLFKTLRRTKTEPSGMFATCDFESLKRRTTDLLVGQWKYQVINSEEERTHWGYCGFSLSGPMLQLAGMRMCTVQESDATECRIPWRARFLVYTNEPMGKFLQFEYNIRLRGENIEAYSKVDLVHLRVGRMTGTYDHLAGGAATGRIEFMKQSDSPYEPIEGWDDTSNPATGADG